jgi:hypothetical protein
MTNAVFDSACVLSRTAQLPEAELGPEDTVLLDADNGVYYGLEGPARMIWDMLETKLTFSEICHRLVQHYDVDPETCQRDTAAFVQQMIEAGLVKAS